MKKIIENKLIYLLSSLVIIVTVFFSVRNTYAAEQSYTDINPARSNLMIMTLKDDMPYENAMFTLSKYVAGQPLLTVVRNFQTDNMGFYNIGSFEANTKYELRAKELRTVAYTEDSVVFETDGEGKISRIYSSSEAFLSEPMIFTAFEQNDGNLQTKEVKFKVVDKNGAPVEGVPLTANNITLLSSYQTKNSDANGMVTFELEARGNFTGNISQDMLKAKSYSVTVSKNGQFMWDFNPMEITIFVFENKVVSFRDIPLTVVVEKNDRTHLISDLKKLINDSKAYIEENTFTNKLSLKKAKDTIKVAEEELAKETIPGYAEALIQGLNDAMKELKKFEEVKISTSSNPSMRYRSIQSKSSNEITFDKNSIMLLQVGNPAYKTMEKGKVVTKKMETSPIIRNGNVMLPIRVVFEKIGINVKFNNASKTIYFADKLLKVNDKKVNVIELSLRNNSILVNGKKIVLDTNVLNENGRAFLQTSDIEKICREFGVRLDIQFNRATNQIKLNK